MKEKPKPHRPSRWSGFGHQQLREKILAQLGGDRLEQLQILSAAHLAGFEVIMHGRICGDHRGLSGCSTQEIGADTCGYRSTVDRFAAIASIDVSWSPTNYHRDSIYACQPTTHTSWSGILILTIVSFR
jgi:hypothetical protein